MRIYVQHGALFLCDVLYAEPSPMLSSEASSRGFAENGRCLSLCTLIQDPFFVTDISRNDHELDESTFVVECSLFLESGDLRLSETDNLEVPIWKGRPGWVRVRVGQKGLRRLEPGHDPEDENDYPEVQLVIVVKESDGEEPAKSRGDVSVYCKRCTNPT